MQSEFKIFKITGIVWNPRLFNVTQQKLLIKNGSLEKLSIDFNCLLCFIYDVLHDF